MGMPKTTSLAIMTERIKEEQRWPELIRVRRAIVVVDLVESVRIMQAFEADVIDRWRRFVAEVRDQVLPVHHARMVKSLGDGMLLEYEQAPAAVAGSFDLLARLPRFNVGRHDDAAMHLRVGIHLADVVSDEHDVYGAGVNLTARLAGLGAPGDIVVSAEVRDALLVGIDAEVEDLGDCYLKHLVAPQRAFKLRKPGMPQAWRARRALGHVAPSVVVMPIATDSAELGDGAALADDLIAAIGRSTVLRPVARRCVPVLAGRQVDAMSFAVAAHAHYVVAGELHRSAATLHFKWTLHEVSTRALIHSGHWQGSTQALLNSHDGLAVTVALEIMAVLVRGQLQIEHHAALANLPSYALMLRAVALMHRLSDDDFERARQALEAVVERNPRSPEALSWTAKWHFYQVTQARSSDPMASVGRAREQLHRALGEDASHALALAIDGHLDAFVNRDLSGARDKLQRALDADANEPLASLFMANVLAYSGHGDEAVAAVEQAEILSPLDPMRFMYDLFASTAYSSAGRHDMALKYAERSVQQCALHLSALVQLIVARAQAGQMDRARQTAAQYLMLRPAASVQLFMDRHIAAGTAVAQAQADALLAAGMPL